MAADDLVDRRERVGDGHPGHSKGHSLEGRVGAIGTAFVILRKLEEILEFADDELPGAKLLVYRPKAPSTERPAFFLKSQMKEAAETGVAARTKADTGYQVDSGCVSKSPSGGSGAVPTTPNATPSPGVPPVPTNRTQSCTSRSADSAAPSEGVIRGHPRRVERPLNHAST